MRICKSTARSRDDRFRRADRPSGNTGHPRRGAALLLEGLAGGILVTALLLAVIPVASRIQRQQRHLEHREAALAEAHSVLTELSTRPWDQLVEGETTVSVNPELEAILSDGKVRTTVSDHEEPVGKRLQVEIEWRSESDSVKRSVQLLAFVFRNGER